MKKFFKWVGILLGGFIALIVVIGVTASPSAKTGEAAASAEPVKEEPPMAATAQELLTAYKDNEVAADQKFKGKKLAISAKVDAIQSGMGDAPFLVLKAGGEYEFNKPQAHMESSESNKVAALKKGQSVNLVCIGNGEIGGTAMLDDCVLQ